MNACASHETRGERQISAGRAASTKALGQIDVSLERPRDTEAWAPQLKTTPALQWSGALSLCLRFSRVLMVVVHGH